MEKITINATTRDVIGKKVKAARREGKLPAIIYGKNLDKPLPVFLQAHETELNMQHISQTTLIDIKVDEKEIYPALVRDTQRDVIYRNLLHIDFLAVSMTEKLTAYVQIRLVGEAPAVKEYGAILVTGFEEVEIECLPGDLPESLELDISGLNEIGDSLQVKDLTIPVNVTLLAELEEMVVQVTAPMAAEAEEEELEEEVEEMEEPDVIEKGKAEEIEEEE